MNSRDDHRRTLPGVRLPVDGDRPEGTYICVGGNIGRTKACFRLTGEDLDPDVVTEALRCAPSCAHRRGDPISPDGRGSRRRGVWLLNSRLDESHGIDDHVGDLLRGVTGDLAVWATLARFNPEVFCGLFLTGFNQGDTLASTTMGALGARGVRLGLDIYSDESEEQERSSDQR